MSFPPGDSPAVLYVSREGKRCDCMESPWCSYSVKGEWAWPLSGERWIITDRLHFEGVGKVLSGRWGGLINCGTMYFAWMSKLFGYLHQVPDQSVLRSTWGMCFGLMMLYCAFSEEWIYFRLYMKLFISHESKIYPVRPVSCLVLLSYYSWIIFPEFKGE